MNTIAALEYSTWPSTRLRTTIKEVVHLYLKDQSKNVYSIIDELECEFNDKYPLHVAEQFDFCMLCSQIDKSAAVQLQTYLCSEYNLTGKVLWECITLGQDVYTEMEDMVNNSTKVLFFVTEEFDENDPCAHIARNLLLKQKVNGIVKNVLIPLVTDFNTPVPDTFKLIDKLYLCSKLQFQYRFPAIFTEEVKKEKIERTNILKRKLDSERRNTLELLVQKKFH